MVAAKYPGELKINYIGGPEAVNVRVMFDTTREYGVY
jgi:hypothetical protein